ncbi:MAG: DNA mismatch repair protein MutS [Clostridia bacterium]|nr:DNA mismatch repair protein MutS [Clostridia bacterium]
MKSVTPMMQQYLTMKEEHPDELLFYRLGDFYEMFFDDALTASRELELTLTGRDCGLEERAPMCGVPHHAVDTYITRLVEKGYRVAICEQMEDPSVAKGIVKRAITRIVTPGTITDQSALSERKNNYLTAVCIEGKRAGIAYVDITTGEFFATQLSNAERELRGALASIAPGEIITNNAPVVSLVCNAPQGSCPQTAFQGSRATELLLKHFGVASLTALGFDNTLLPAAHAAGALMRYIADTQMTSMSHMTTIRIQTTEQTMPLDAPTRRNLELTEGLSSRSVRGSLLWLLDKTATAMGGRMLRRWIEQPLLAKDAIEKRLQAVSTLHGSHVLSERLYEILGNVYDMERILSKVSYGTLNARDCLALLRSLNQVPPLMELLSGDEYKPVVDMLGAIDPLQDLTTLLFEAINPEAPLLITDGDVIKKGYNARLDELRDASQLGKTWINELEQREREETGIKNLKISFNRVFGYYIEVTKSYYTLVPLRYQRRQTLASSERYTTDELRELENKIMGAQDQSAKLELELFSAVRDRVRAAIPQLQATATALKTLDALLSLARVAIESNYVCPVISESGDLVIRDGRHPVVEKTMSDGMFVPNDTEMNIDEKRMQIITGPNMAGKSTYMRQVALIVLMAHIGSFVPAREAMIPLVDNVFTRIGASDDLAGGQSTFMVEMSETAYILRNATNRSLVILDEIGRGTSTFDGLSIAWSTVEYLCDQNKCGAKTLFATHYHELSELEGVLNGVTNYQISVKEHGEEVIFLRKIVRGGADKSFGVYVARLAGVPHSVVARAQEIEARLEANNITQNTIGKNILEKGKKKNQQQDLFEYGKTELIEELGNLDVLSMSPINALNTLFLLREKARKL